MEESAKAIARPAASRSLREAVRKARLEEAERLHLSADNRDGEIARLELLKAELETVFAELPANDDRFNLVLVPSRPARLWIDLFTYATVDDSGAYLFVRNSESGRRTLYSSSNIPRSPTASRATWRTRSCTASGWRAPWPSPAAQVDSDSNPLRRGPGWAW